MKNRKFLLLLIVSICSVSFASAQGYVDDLYYSRQTKAEKEAELKRQQLKLASQKEKRESKIDVRQYDDEYYDKDSDEEEYYPGMFADMVNGNRDNASKRGGDDRSSGSDSKVRVEIVSVWSPSWYSYSSWGGAYYSPWGRSMWHDPFDPFYSYGWGYNSCYSGWYGWQGHGWRGCDPYYYRGYHNSWNHGWNGGWNNGWNGGWNNGWNGGWNNGWNNNHYYGGGYGYSASKYNSNNTVTGGGRRPGSTMVGSSTSSGRYNNSSSRGGNYTISNRLERDTRSNTRINGTSNSTGNRYNTNSNRTNTETRPSQYNRRDTYTPPPTTTRQSGTSTGTSTGTYQRGGNTGTGNSGGGTVVHSTRRR